MQGLHIATARTTFFFGSKQWQACNRSISFFFGGNPLFKIPPWLKHTAPENIECRPGLVSLGLGWNKAKLCDCFSPDELFAVCSAWLVSVLSRGFGGAPREGGEREQKTELERLTYQTSFYMTISPLRFRPCLPPHTLGLDFRSVETQSFDSTHNVHVPALVYSLAPYKVLQVGCGGGHTLVVAKRRARPVSPGAVTKVNIVLEHPRGRYYRTMLLGES